MYKAKKNFSFKGIFYDEGDSVDVETKEELVLLNEKGFIEPLTMKEIQNFGKKESKKIDKEDNDNGFDTK